MITDTLIMSEAADMAETSKIETPGGFPRKSILDSKVEKETARATWYSSGLASAQYRSPASRLPGAVWLPDHCSQQKEGGLMARFTEAVTVVNRLSGRVHQWELCEPMSYRLTDAGHCEVVNVPPKFKTDFASVPRPFWFWLAPWGRHGRAAIVHDFLYQLGAVTDPASGTLRRPSKRESDRIFRQAMVVLDRVILSRSARWRRLPMLLRVRLAFAGLRRWLMWGAVTVFGHWAYQRQQNKGTAPPLEHDMLVAVAALTESAAYSVADAEPDTHTLADASDWRQ
jgi:Protein of unknown function (DUF1353)